MTLRSLDFMGIEYHQVLAKCDLIGDDDLSGKLTSEGIVRQPYRLRYKTALSITLFNRQGSLSH